MVSKVVKVVNAEGLHMRPAGIKKDTEVEIIVTGENEQAVLDEFVKMFEDGFGE